MKNTLERDEGEAMRMQCKKGRRDFGAPAHLTKLHEFVLSLEPKPLHQA